MSLASKIYMIFGFLTLKNTQIAGNNLIKIYNYCATLFDASEKKITWWLVGDIEVKSHYFLRVLRKNPYEAPIYLCFASINAWMTQTVVIFWNRGKSEAKKKKIRKETVSLWYLTVFAILFRLLPPRVINPTNLEAERELKDHLLRTTNYRKAQSLSRLTNKLKIHRTIIEWNSIN